MGGDRLTITFKDDIAFFDAGNSPGGAGDDTGAVGGFADDKRAVVGGKVSFSFEVFINGQVADTEEWFANAAVFFEVFQVAVGGVNGNGKADVLGAVDDGGVDADDAASGVKKRTAGVARIDGGVSLDKAAHFLNGGGGVNLGANGTGKAGDNASGDSVAEKAKGVADGNNWFSQ